MELLRNDNYTTTVDKRMTERANMFNSNSRFDKFNDNIVKKDNYGKFPDASNVGEITGETLELSDTEVGMPMRCGADSQAQTNMSFDHTIKIEQNKYNPRLDFNLYEKKPQMNVSYFDPLQAGVASQFGSDYNAGESADLSETLNQFSLNLLNVVNNNNSLILSPFSIMQLMSLLYKGSSGQTERELKNFFSFSGKQNTFSNIRKVARHLTKSVNAVFFSHNFPVNRAFADHVETVGFVDNVDVNRSVKETHRINGIVGNMTGGTINVLLEPGVINKNTRIILVNSIYFYSRWKNPFSVKHTKLELFHSLNRRKIMMMKQTDKTYNYFEDEYYQLLELDYKDDIFSFGIMLPKYNTDMKVQFEQVQYYVSQMNKTELEVIKIPKFKQGSKFKMDNIFKKMGLKQLFVKADLSDITPSSDHLRVSTIVHQAFISVDEAGTKASAATACEVQEYGCHSEKKKIQFIANHPFIYYIRCIPENTFMFLGHFY